MRPFVPIAVALLAATAHTGRGADAPPRCTVAGRVAELNTTDRTLRITAYGAHTVRVQVARAGAAFPDAEPYPMVERHDHPGELRARRDGTETVVETAGGALAVRIDAAGRLRWAQGGGKPFLRERAAVTWSEPADRVPPRLDARLAFEFDPDEHFAGLGHPAFGRLDRLDRAGGTHAPAHGNQAPLVVPFFLSSRGYGLFLNTVWRPRFDFAGKYELAAAVPPDTGHLDYFVFAGPAPAAVIERYTRLTGRPRLPPLAAFGLALSDKGPSGDFEPTPEGWAQKVQAHRAAGFPLDHLVFDNRWRAGGGTRARSRFEWEPKRFPDPARFAAWCRDNGLVVTLDLNRVNCQLCPGWTPRFNVGARGWADQVAEYDPRPRKAGELRGDTSLPDFTRPEVLDWMWATFRDKNFDPKLKYPGPGLWLDEFDAYGADPHDRLANGRTWDETSGAWFLLLARGVGERWARDVGPDRRPFVWVRGGSAGMQRYATLWSGDIYFGDDEMKRQVRGMLSAGASGFPFWGHDAGGFMPSKAGGPQDLDDERYARWSLALGSFSPFWKPHGHRTSRWPADRPALPPTAKLWCELRYRLMPYTYALAVEASATGVPMARPMFLAHPDRADAWARDLQFTWGPHLLVVPSYAPAEKAVGAWLPPGTWHRFLDPSEPALAGGRAVNEPLRGRELALFAPAGAVIPMAEPALGTALIDRSRLEVRVFAGADGRFDLHEDDGTTERYRFGERRTTALRYADAPRALTVAPAVGTYAGAPATRSYSVAFHGLAAAPNAVAVNGRRVALRNERKPGAPGAAWDAGAKVLTVETGPRAVTAFTTVALDPE